MPAFSRSLAQEIASLSGTVADERPAAGRVAWSAGGELGRKPASGRQTSIGT